MPHRRAPKKSKDANLAAGVASDGAFGCSLQSQADLLTETRLKLDRLEKILFMIPSFKDLYEATEAELTETLQQHFDKVLDNVEAEELTIIQPEAEASPEKCISCRLDRSNPAHGTSDDVVTPRRRIEYNIASTECSPAKAFTAGSPARTCSAATVVEELSEPIATKISALETNMQQLNNNMAQYASYSHHVSGVHADLFYRLGTLSSEVAARLSKMDGAINHEALRVDSHDRSIGSLIKHFKEVNVHLKDLTGIVKEPTFCSNPRR